MHLAVACGGTGGHTFPGVATARVLRDAGHQVTLWLAGRPTEAAVVSGWDGGVEHLVARSPGGGWGRTVGVAVEQAMAVREARKRLRRNPPDALLAMGSYASCPPVLAAWSLRIPVVLHEANAIPGQAVAWLARLSRAIGITFPEAAAHLPAGRTLLTGLPMRTFAAAPARRTREAGASPTLLVMGGSQGAHALNTRIPAALASLHQSGMPLRVIHLAGQADAAQVEACYARAGMPHVVHGFLPAIGEAYQAADLALCRSGAGSCMELAACGLPAILVPLPSARRNHQHLNARYLATQGGAVLLPQSELTEARVAREVRALLETPARLESMRDALTALAVTDGAQRLAALVIRCAAGGGRHAIHDG